MAHHHSRQEKIIIALALLLACALPTAASAQTVVMRVNDAVVAKFISGSVYGLYDITKDPSHCIGTYDPSAFNRGQDALIPAGLSNAAELQAISDAAPAVNGKHFVQMTLYKGPSLPPLGDCAIAQNPAGLTQPPPPPANNYAASQAAYDANMKAFTNSVRVTWKIIKADPKTAIIQISDTRRIYTMKIEHGGTLSALGSMYRNSVARGDYSNSTATLKGQDIKLSIDGSVARWYKQDGTPDNTQESHQLAGLSTTTIMYRWNSDDLTKMGNDLIEKAKAASGGADPEYVNVARELGNKGVFAAPTLPNN